MRSLFPRAALCLLLTVPAFSESLWPELSKAAKSTGGGEKDAAVIVGAQDYAYVSDVPGARRNADEWHAYLTGTLNVPSERVALLRDGDATLEEMRRFAAEKASEVESGGTLWFVFIGHGAPSKDGKDGLLIGADAQQKAESLYARSLPRAELLGLLGKGKQAKTVVLLDACFSGRSGSGDALVAGLQPLIVSRGGAQGVDARTIMLTAAKSDQFAGPLPKSDEARPAFSYLALGGLRGWAAGPDGSVTAGGLKSFIERALKLAKDRIQTPELAAGKPDALLGRGREAAPDLAKIDREGADGFQVSAPGAVPKAQAPAALDAAASGLDFRSVDLAALREYNAAFKLDKSDAGAEEKASAWRALVVAAPKFKELAEKRAAEWDAYAAQKKVSEEAVQARRDARDADWEKLSQLLELDVIPAGDKRKWAAQFAGAYRKSPGLALEMALALAPHMTGAARVELEILAKQAAETPASSGQAPAVYSARFATTKGDFTVRVTRAWSPLGADRFYQLLKLGYYDGAPLFRIVKGFMAQFGISADAAANAKWKDDRFKDDPTGVKSNTRGMMTFAHAGPDTRTTQVFINYADNGRLDGQFTPFGEVVSGMDVVDAFYGEYGERGPAQGRLQAEGAGFVKSEFPKLDFIKTARIVGGAALAAKAAGGQRSASGLIYEELKAGDGPSPKATDTVKVHYEGKFPGGAVFDSSYQRGAPAEFPLNGVIKCWTEGVQKMRAGGKAKLICPPDLAYGSAGAGSAIPPNATLEFTVELLGIR